MNVTETRETALLDSVQKYIDHMKFRVGRAEKLLEQENERGGAARACVQVIAAAVGYTRPVGIGVWSDDHYKQMHQAVLDRLLWDSDQRTLDAQVMKAEALQAARSCVADVAQAVKYKRGPDVPMWSQEDYEGIAEAVRAIADEDNARYQHLYEDVLGALHSSRNFQ